MQPDAADMLVVTKAYELVLWSSQHVARFPRSHRFTLGELLLRRLYAILDQLIRAKYNRDRRPILQGVNLELELLRFQLRLAHDLRCLSTGSYGHAAQSVNEIGQMVGGWLRSTSGPRPAACEGVRPHEAPRPPLG
jgi:hypothetical protein